MKTKPTARLENWSVNQNVRSLQGNVYGHKAFADETYVYTSSLVGMDEDAVITKNTRYSLGKPFNPQQVVLLQELKLKKIS